MEPRGCPRCGVCSLISNHRVFSGSISSGMYLQLITVGFIKGSAYTIDPAQSQVSLISNLDSFAIFQE